MRTIFAGMAILVLVASMMPSAWAADSHRVEFAAPAQFNGVQIEPGKYKLVLNGDQVAELWDGKELLLKAKVEIVPLEGATPQSVSTNGDGSLKEIRLKKERVVFLES